MTAPLRGAALNLQGLTKHYGGTAAVDDISLSINPGEFLTLLGPSGSGKTTTLNIIAGFTTASHGSVVLQGRDISTLPAHKRNIGVVFQNYALFPHLTVFENVAFPLKRRKVNRREIQRRVHNALDLVQLEGLFDRLPRQLSGGQQQRVALARALVFEPPLLLMDEPLGALDRKLREALQVELKRIHREVGSTFVYVTHDQEEALALSDRIAVFRAGRVEQVGTGIELYRRPETLFVATFVGESSILDGLVFRRDGARIVVRSGLLPELVVITTDTAAVGEAVSLVLRPEDVQILPLGHRRGSEENAIEGRLEHVLYLGANHRATVLLDDGRRLTATMRGREVLPASEGDRVLLRWDALDSVLVPGHGDPFTGARPQPEPVSPASDQPATSALLS